MFTLIAYLKEALEQPAQTADEAYLSGATDLADLERRMRYLENDHLDQLRNPILQG
jgi:hypothetical protein